MCTVLAATSARAMRRLWPGRRRCPLGRWLLRASRVADTARRLMWSENALKMPRYSVSLTTCVCVCTVGIWSYVLGNIHFWTCPILWDPCHEHSECPQIWPETGETYQRHLLWQHVTQKGFEIGVYPSNRSSYDVMTVCWSEISGDQTLRALSIHLMTSWRESLDISTSGHELWNIVTFCGVSYSYWVIATLFSKL